MTIWFAQNSTVNIDSVNQWNDVADGSGNWLTWASLDAADILVANAKTAITINVDVTCVRITTSNADGGTAGGGFTLAAGVTVTADLVAGTTVCVTASFSSGTGTIIGNINGSLGTPAGSGVRFSGTGGLDVIGNVFAGQAAGTNTGLGIDVSAAGTLNVTGNAQSSMISGSGGNAQGIKITGAAIVNVTGDCRSVGTGGGNAAGIWCNNAGATVTVTGNCFGPTIGNRADAAGAIISAGLFVLNGTAVASSNGSAVSLSGTASFHHNGNIEATASARNAISMTHAVTHTISSSSTLRHDYKSRTSGSGAIGEDRPLFTGGTNLGQPVIADVRFGATFGVTSEYTGALRVPDPQYVLPGVLTDDTVGTATLATAAALAAVAVDATTAADQSTAAATNAKIAAQNTQT